MKVIFILGIKSDLLYCNSNKMMPVSMIFSFPYGNCSYQDQYILPLVKPPIEANLIRNSLQKIIKIQCLFALS